jgi:hypothetical protein
MAKENGTRVKRVEVVNGVKSQLNLQLARYWRRFRKLKSKIGDRAQATKLEAKESDHVSHYT